MDAQEVTAVVVTILVFVVMAAAVTALIVWLVVRNRREQARLAAMSPAERHLHDASKALQAHRKSASQSLRTAITQHEQLVAAAGSQVAEARRIGFRPLGAFQGIDGSLELFEDHIAYSTRGRTWRYALEPSIVAQVDASGSVYSTERTTLTRMAGGAVVAGGAGLVAGAAARKTTVHDGRELYLTVTGAEFSVTISCNPAFGAGARQFSSAIFNASRNAGRLQAARPVEIERAEAYFESVRVHYPEVRSAEARLAAIDAELAQVAAAQRALPHREVSR